MRHVLRAAAAAAAALLAAVTLPAPARAADPCAGWATSTLATGLGDVENLLPDGRGGLYLSINDQAKVVQLGADGTVRTVATGLDHPAGLRRIGADLYVLTGNSPGAILWGGSNGTLVKLNPATGAKTVVTRGLRAPNGLALLPDGTFLASRINPFNVEPTGITRIDPRTGVATPNWAPIQMSNGMAVSPDGRTVFVNQTFTGQVLRVATAETSRRSAVLTIPGSLPAPDDIDITAQGVLYVVTHLEGAVHRVDPATGARCTVAKGLGQPTSVKVVPDGAGQALAVTSFDGTVKKLTPPAGQRP